MSTRNVSIKPKLTRKGDSKKVKSLSSSSAVKAPVSMGIKVSYREPVFQSLPKGAVRIKHREFFSDITGSALAFGVRAFIPVNPANSEMFPWLSALATRYESYKFHSLKVIYEPLVPTSSFGVVLMAIDYDATDLPPGSKSQMMSYDGAVRGSVWLDVSLNSSKANLQKIPVKYTLDHAPGANQDLKLYNVGTLIVAMAGTLDTTVKGELYVEYDVEFTTPALEQDEAVFKLQYTGLNSVTQLFADPTLYNTSAPSGTDSIYGFGTAAGLAASVFGIYKTGVYLWNSYMSPTAGNATLTPVSVIPDTNATVTSNNTGLGSVSGFTNGANVGATEHLITVNKAPAFFNTSAAPQIPTTNLLVGSSITLTRQGDL
jgi:hypothetical protein